MIQQLKTCSAQFCNLKAEDNGFCTIHQSLAPKPKGRKKKAAVGEDVPEVVPDIIEILVSHIRRKYDFIRATDGLYWRVKESADIWTYDAAPLINREIWEHRNGVTGDKYPFTGGFIDAVTRGIEAECGLPEPWEDPPIEEIPFKNGVFNWRTQEFKIGYSKHDRHLHTLAADYKTDTSPGFINDLMKDWIGDDTTILYQIIALCMLQGYYPASKVFFLYGKGGDGKSRYIDVIRGILGKDNISGVTPQNLEKKEFAPCNLYRKFANIAGDIPYDALKDPSLLKMMTGEEYIDANVKYKSPITFKSYATLLFSTNKLPSVNDETDGFWRRMFILRFPNQIPSHLWDITLPAKIAAARDELSAVAVRAAWMLKDMEKNNWKLRGELDIEQTQKEHLYDSNPIGYFVQNYCEETDYHGTNVTTFKNALLQWAVDNGKNPKDFTSQRINAWMNKAKIIKKQDENRCLYWEGLDLKGKPDTDY